MAKKSKHWERKRDTFSRPYGERGCPKERILIVCEGEKTEPKYFESFRVSSSAVINIKGLGYNTVSLVEKTIEINEEEKKGGDKFDQVWCVFDRDSFPVDNFNKAIGLAERNGFNTAYSNESFELWYLLHFIYFDSAISRKDYIIKLEKHLGDKYKKNSEDMYEELIEKQQTAISRAKKLLKNYPSKNPGRSNPSTTVHFLVEELNKYL
ncbi:MAG: RloB domain-containing protein [bacterium]|nr:RloB domain-containing protein [bacterium]